MRYLLITLALFMFGCTAPILKDRVRTKLDDEIVMVDSAHLIRSVDVPIIILSGDKKFRSDEFWKRSIFLGDLVVMRRSSFIWLWTELGLMPETGEDK